jgi:hypothetical protein
MIKEHKQNHSIPKNPNVNSLDGVDNFLNLFKTAKPILSNDTITTDKNFVGSFTVRGVDTTTYSAETVFDSSKSAFKKIRTVGANANFNMTTGGKGGQELYLQIDNDTDANRTIVFGGKFKVSGSLAGSTNATAMLQFISNGSNFMEVSRVTGINQ